MKHPMLAAAALIAFFAAPAHPLDLRLDWKFEAPADYLAGATPLRLPDGHVAALIAAKDGAIRAFGPGGAILWEHKRPGRVTTPLAVGDVDGDRLLEVVGADQAGLVFCLAANGALKWETPLAGKAVWSYPALGDLDGDGKLEAVVGDDEGYLSCLDYRGALRWRIKVPGGFACAAALGDVDAEPGLEILVGDDSGRFYAFDDDGLLLWRRQVKDQIFSSAVLADLDADGRYEVVFGTGFHDGGLYALDALSGEVRWRVEAGDDIDSAIAAADVDGDGKVEIVFGDGRGRVRLVDCRGEVRWTRQLPESDIGQVTVASAPVIADLDGDGALEIICPEHDGAAVYVLDLAGEIIASYPVREGMNGSPLVLNLDRDPQAEVICPAHRANLLLCLEASGELGAAPWPSVRGFPALHGRVATSSGARHTRVISSPLTARARAQAPRLPVDDSTLGAGWNTVVCAGVQGPELVSIVSPSGVRQAAYFEESGERVWRFWIGENGQHVLTHVVLDARLRPTAEWRGKARVALFRREQDEMARLAADLAAVQSKLAASRPEAAALAARVQYDCSRVAQTYGPQTRNFARMNLRAQQEFIVQWRAEREVLRQRVSVLQAAARAPESPRTVLVGVSADPYAQYPEAAPAPPAERREIALTVLGGEYEVAAVELVNITDRNLTVRAWVEGDASLVQHIFAARVQSVPTLTGAWSADALVPLDAIGAIQIPRLEGRQLWLRADGRGLAPGKYQAAIRFQVLGAQRDDFEIPLTIERLPIELEVEKRVAFCMWSHADIMGRQYRDQALADQFAHHVNVWTVGIPVSYPYDAQGNLVGAVDWSALDAQCRLYGPDAIFLFPGDGDVTRFVGEGQPTPEAREKAYRDWLTLFCAHMAELGYPNSRYALYPIDEPGIRAGSAQRLFEIARRAKQACPDIWVYTDPVGALSLEEFDLIAPYIDIWMPSGGMAYNTWTGQPSSGHERALYERIKAQGDPVWMYAPMGGKLTPPLGAYRGEFWVGIAHGHVGQGYWTYFSAAPELDPWQGITSYPGKAGGHEYGLVYNGVAGPVGSKRWEACGEGAEDMALFALLREKAAQASGPVAAQAREFAQSGPWAVLKARVTYDAIMAARARAIQLLERLAASG